MFGAELPRVQHYNRGGIRLRPSRLQCFNTFSVTNQFTVEDAFLVEGRGLIAAGKMDGVRHGFSIGARVRISRPDGTQFVCAVRGARVSRPCLTEGFSIDVLLEGVLAREEVPRGSVVALESG